MAGRQTVSDAVFAIIAAVGKRLTLTSPNGGENLAAGATHLITWNGSESISNVTLAYSSDAGNSWQVIAAATENDHSYGWVVPASSSTTGLIKITAASAAAVSDISDGVFTITSSASLTVTAPNGGETWEGGSRQTIRWTSAIGVSRVTLAYSGNNGADWSIIAENVANTGQFEWEVPRVQTAEACVRVSDADNPDAADQSDGVFTINGAALVLSAPNGGETCLPGTLYPIIWTSSGVVVSVRIEFSVDGGDWQTMTPSTQNDGRYDWLVPNVHSQNVLVRISSAGGEQPSDISDAPFTIAGSPTGVASDGAGGSVPEDFALFQNYPNPFNLGTRIDFAVPRTSEVVLKLFNVSGGLVRTLFDDQLAPGTHSVLWDGLDASGSVMTSGLYIYQIRIGAWQASRRLLLVK